MKNYRKWLNEKVRDWWAFSSFLVANSDIIFSFLDRVENFFGVLDAPGHLTVFGLEGLGQTLVGLNALFTGKQHSFFLCIE